MASVSATLCGFQNVSIIYLFIYLIYYLLEVKDTQRASLSHLNLRSGNQKAGYWREMYLQRFGFHFKVECLWKEYVCMCV